LITGLKALIGDDAQHHVFDNFVTKLVVQVTHASQSISGLDQTACLSR
jgi:hypothetical protein